MLRLLHWFYTWLFFVPMLALVTFTLGMLVLITSPFAPRFTNRVWPCIWARWNFLLTPAWVTVSGLENINQGNSYIIAVNHISQHDILVLYGWLPVDLKWVMKKELGRVPVIGIACKALGHIFLDRSNREAAVASLQFAKENLRPGSSILFFPEGTRSDDGQLMPFKKGAFVMAKDMDLPILPITLAGTDKILPNGTLALRPGKAQMIIHSPVPLERVRSSSAEELATLTRDMIGSQS